MRISVGTFLFMTLAFTVFAQPADFGDAIMEPVPTLLANGGPYHLDVSQEWIGESPSSTTTTEMDALPNDANDGYIEVSEVYLDGAFNLMGQVRVPVTTSENTSIRYLNVALDLDNNGVFCTYPVGTRVQYEWVVVNLPIVFTGETKVVTSYFTLHGPLNAGKGRATLSTEPIVPALFGLNGWDGSGPVGGFLRGETEDFFPFTSGIYNYDRSPDAINMPPPLLYYDPPNRPVPPPSTYETPRGPARLWPPEQGPSSQPVSGDPPEIPEADEPTRLDNDPVGNPIIDQDSVKNMPDIKQGPDECVPASTANSLRYLLNRAGETVEDDDAFNRDLFEKLRDAMKTNQNGKGTHIEPQEPENNDFINGKKTAKIHPKLRNGKVTTVQANPTRDNIINAIKQKKNVEIVIYCYNKNADVVEKHMVTVVGFVKYADGRIELKIHNPNDKKAGEGSGDTASKPREATITILPGQSDRGGLIVRGLVRNGGEASDVYEIQMMFAEHLASENVSVTIEPPVTPPIEGQSMELIAHVIDKDKAVTHYQWIKDDTDILGANSPVYYLDDTTLLDSGEYSCWAYDETTDTYGISDPVLVTVLPKETMPASSMVALLVMLVVLGGLSMRFLTQKRPTGDL